MACVRVCVCLCVQAFSACMAYKTRTCRHGRICCSPVLAVMAPEMQTAPQTSLHSREKRGHSATRPRYVSCWCLCLSIFQMGANGYKLREENVTRPRHVVQHAYIERIYGTYKSTHMILCDTYCMYTFICVYV